MDWDWHNYFNFFMKIMTRTLLLIALIVMYRYSPLLTQTNSPLIIYILNNCLFVTYKW